MNNSYPFNVSFYIRKNKNNKKNYSVYCCIKILETSPRELCVVNDMNRSEWNLRKGRPKQNSDKMIKLSLYLDKIKAELFEIYLDIKLHNGELSAENIKNIYTGKSSNDITILELVDVAIIKYQKEFAKGTLKNYGATKAYVESFCKKNINPVRLN
jgi:integrase/recombinase XerD